VNRAIARNLLALAAAVSCSKGSTPSAAANTVPEDPPPAAAPMDPIEAEAWAHAQSGEEEDRMRLADLVGCTSLRERAEVTAQRSTAIFAMRYCEDFSELPWLVTVASTGPDDEAAGALDTILDQAAQPRRQVDPEDAQELAEGCQGLLVLSRSARQARTKRVMAVRALRMLSDRGCVKRADIPVDFDAKN
jgi:hypothetical protein